MQIISIFIIIFFIVNFNPFLCCSLLYLAEGKRDLSAPWARYVGDIAGVTNPKIVIVDLYNQQVGLQSSAIVFR